MPFIIVDERHIDEALSNLEWMQIKKLAWLYPVIYRLARGETVEVDELTDACGEMNPCPSSIQKLVAYALGGNSVRIKE